MSDKLLPCPFCGGEPDVSKRMDENIWDHSIVEWTSVRCCECDIQFEWPPGAEPDPFTQWNTRSNPSHAQLAAARSALEPFARVANDLPSRFVDDAWITGLLENIPYCALKVGDLRHARALSTLAQEPAGQSEANNMAGVAEQSGAGAPETSVRCGAPAAFATAQQSEVQDIRWAVNYLLEQIAGKLADWPTLDIWRSEAADLVRSFKHDLSQAPQSPGVTATVPLADHDAVGIAVLNQPWEVQKEIITITAHCTAIMDQAPSKEIADIAGCISHCCADLASALTAHPTVKVSGDAAPDEYFRDDPMFNKGVLHCQDLLGQVLGNPEYYAADGSEDYDTDLSDTLVNMLSAAGCYDKDEGKLAQIGPEVGGDATEMRERLEKVRRVMKAARNSKDHLMNIWSDDMKTVDEVCAFLDAITPAQSERDGGRP